MHSSVLAGGDEGRQESQEQNEVDHGDFEMVVRQKGQLKSVKTIMANPNVCDLHGYCALVFD